MKKLFKIAVGFLFVFVFVLGATTRFTSIKAANVDGYVALDATDPIEFGGTYIVYKGDTIHLGPKAIYVDGSLSQAVAEKYQYVYTSITEALSAGALTDGSESDPMVVYVAPYVYWIDDPDATNVVGKTPNYNVPYGMVVKCKWLKLQGLTTNPYNVIIAGNRGQSNGADGNYTMFRFNGDGLNLDNITIGNYCSIDLNYNLKPSLNHAKRTSTITQAQLGDVSGDKVVATNCNFISRLNLDPLGGGTRTLYYNCHFESTDDALNGNAVYLQCNFDFYGNRPFYSTYNTGAVLLNCQFKSVVLNVEAEPNQYFTKEGGPVTVVDSNFTSNFSIPFGIGWTKYPLKSLRSYQYNVTHNEVGIYIGGQHAPETVDMTGLQVLNAYRINYGGKVYYNTYNLLRGNDDWDPMNVKSTVVAAGIDDGKDYTSIATMLTVSSNVNTIESGVSTATLTSKVQKFDGAVIAEDVTLSLTTEDQHYANLTKNLDGTYTLTGTNVEDYTKNIIVYASTDSGLESAVALDVKPTILAAPEFKSNPVITNIGNGKLKVDYALDLAGRTDHSIILWYRCSDENGSDPILVSVTRNNDPEKEYTLQAGDIGYYLKAVVEPKSIRSNPGTGVAAITSDVVKLADVKAKTLSTNFKNFPGTTQTRIIPGFWTSDCFKPADTASFTSWKENTSVNPWVYGVTGNGSVGAGLYQGTQGARLMYTPVNGVYGDMSLNLTVDPAKTAGQGFGSAGQYMDICIKFDTTTLTGYGLRIIRTKAASNATTFVLVKYENGTITEISNQIIASCFVTGCQISLKVEGSKLTVHVETATAQLADQTAAGYVHSVDLSTDIIENQFGGLAIQYTGTTGTGGWQNTTMLHSLDASWVGNQGIVDASNIITPEDTNTADGNDSVADANQSTSATTTTATGDNTNVCVYLIILFVSFIGLSVLVVYQKKNKRRAI